MFQAQKRLEAEAKANGELPIEDGPAEQHERKGKKGDKKVNTPSLHGKGTPSNAAAPTEESTAQVTKSVAGRTPEVKGPPAILGASAFEEQEKMKSSPSRSSRTKREKRAWEKGEKGRSEKTSMSPAITRHCHSSGCHSTSFFSRPDTRST